MATITLPEWVPQTAGPLAVPAELVHIRCQQLAKTVGIPWGYTMDANDAQALAEAFRLEHAAAKAAHTARLKAERAARKARA